MPTVDLVREMLNVETLDNVARDPVLKLTQQMQDGLRLALARQRSQLSSELHELTVLAQELVTCLPAAGATLAAAGAPLPVPGSIGQG